MGIASQSSDEHRIRALPCWTGQITVEPLKGGLSNESFLVSDAAGKHVARFGKDFPFHHVSRERELIVAKAAHLAGFAPEVRYAEPGVMVSAYLGAKTYDAADVRHNAERIARLMRRFHDEMPQYISGPGFIFWVFHVIRDYGRLLVEKQSRLAGDVPSYLDIARELESAQVPLPIVFGHHDLLPANFLDDGSRLWLIDYEYAGFGTAMFDLAGIASNAEMDSAQSRDLLQAYFGIAPDSAVVRAHSAMQCASLLREAMWGMVSELHLRTPGVDYPAYTRENLARLQGALETHRTLYGKKPQ